MSEPIVTQSDIRRDVAITLPEVDRSETHLYAIDDWAVSMSKGEHNSSNPSWVNSFSIMR